MTLPFTKQQLDNMRRRMLRKAPEPLTIEDVGKAGVVAALTAATTEIGLLVKFQMLDHSTAFRLLSPVVAQQLFIGINQTAEDGNWWAMPLQYQRDPDLTLPTPEDLPGAAEVISLTTASAGPVMVVQFVREAGQRELLQLNRALAGELFLYIQMGVLYIQMGAEAIGWWDETFKLRAATTARITH